MPIADFDLPLPQMRARRLNPDFYRYGHAEGESEEAFSPPAWRRAWTPRSSAEDPETVAAFIAEPVHGRAAASIVPPRDLLRQAMQAVLKKYDVLLIADEVICGFGRTGSRCSARETFALKPDIDRDAPRQLSSAYLPISATADQRRRCYQTLLGQQPTSIGVVRPRLHVLAGHPVCVRRGARDPRKSCAERDLRGPRRAWSAPQLQDGPAPHSPITRWWATCAASG